MSCTDWVDYFRKTKTDLGWWRSLFWIILKPLFPLPFCGFVLIFIAHVDRMKLPTQCRALPLPLSAWTAMHTEKLLKSLLELCPCRPNYHCSTSRMTSSFQYFFLLFPLFNEALPFWENPSATIFVGFSYNIQFKKMGNVTVVVPEMQQCICAGPFLNTVYVLPKFFWKL